MIKSGIKYKFLVLFCCLSSVLFSQSKIKDTRADSLKGTITKEREWWDVQHYDLHVKFNPKDSSISGHNKIIFRTLISAAAGTEMQIDLQKPLQIDSAMLEGKKCNFRRDGNAFFISLRSFSAGEQGAITIYFQGKPKRAIQPPWDGGVVWSKDADGNPWISVACQGIGASVWFPNKDHNSDEADSASIHITVPQTLSAISNGRLRSQKNNPDGSVTFNWAVMNPINNYNIIPYIGRYVNFKDTLNGIAGKLDLDFWVLEKNLEKAKVHFKEVKPMLRCFEHWFGKYPFYEDGYKLVDAPYLGMEHQSNIAYGNFYLKGYAGRDLSLTGWGLKWDFIIIHESGHEWFGNNISVKDVADNWVHEGFTAYSENLYTEYLFGKEAGAEYVIGTRKAIENDVPVIGVYNVNKEGSTDMYYKGANLLHTIRQLVNNDSLWRALLLDMNTTFWHRTTTSAEVEAYMIKFLKLDLTKVFDQYLRTTNIPVLEHKLKNGNLNYRYAKCVKGFSMPVKIKAGEETIDLIPNETWQTYPRKLTVKSISADKNFYILTRIVK